MTYEHAKVSTVLDLINVFVVFFAVCLHFPKNLVVERVYLFNTLEILVIRAFRKKSKHNSF